MQVWIITDARQTDSKGKPLVIAIVRTRKRLGEVVIECVQAGTRHHFYSIGE